MYLNSSSKSYEKKYRKYKSKYLILKSHIGGTQGTLHGGNCDPLPNPEEEDLATTQNLLDLCPEERITIQNKCYDVRGLHTWIINKNSNVLPGLQTNISFEEKQELIQAYEALSKIPVSTILTRDKLIEVYPNLQHETYIRLNNRDYTDIALGTFGDNFLILERLDLNYNNITELQSGIFNNLPALKYLSLNENKIKKLQLGVFDNLSELQSLSLINNDISINGTLQLGLFDNLIKLERLDLEDNKITSLQSGIFNNLPALIQLYLNNNQISIIQQGAFNNLPALTQLSLTDNQISIFQQGMLNNLLSLSELYLGNNQLGIVGGVFGELQLSTFNNLPQLRILYLNNNQIDSISMGSGNQLLSLEVLHLEDNQISEVQHHAFINLPALEILIFNNSHNQMIMTTYYEYYGLSNSVTIY